MNNDAIVKAAEEEGYELAHSEEHFGSTFFGLLIFVKMSDRKLNPDLDRGAFYKPAEEIRRTLEITTAKIDPRASEIREAWRKTYESIYKMASVSPIFMEELPNGYSSDPFYLNQPWFRITSSIGHVVIGWRKSVISIDWKDSVIKKSGEEMFPEEKSTKLDAGIHAWGEEEAVKYIRRLHEEGVK